MLYQTIAIIGLLTIHTEAGCSDIECGDRTCRAVCRSTDGCIWDSSGTNLHEMPCSESDAWYSPDCCISDTSSPTSALPTSSPTTGSPTTETCPVTTSTDCESIATSRCCTLTTACYWLPSSVNSICATTDATGSECCRLVTDEPTPQPTAPPTCPDYSSNSNPCNGYEEDCCPTENGLCQWSTSDICQSEGGPYCCESVTTTAEPTLGEEETTAAPNKYPTPKPTLPSAEKWEMIHPAYKGNHGELLWQVYYGDFSNDARFDEFRKKGRWDAQELQPLIVKDRKFRKYTSNRENFNAQSTVVSDGSSSNSHEVLIGVAAFVLVILFAVWIRRIKGKHGYEPLNDLSVKETNIPSYSQ